MADKHIGELSAKILERFRYSRERHGVWAHSLCTWAWTVSFALGLIVAMTMQRQS